MCLWNNFHTLYTQDTIYPWNWFTWCIKKEIYVYSRHQMKTIFYFNQHYSQNVKIVGWVAAGSSYIPVSAEITSLTQSSPKLLFEILSQYQILVWLRFSLFYIWDTIYCITLYSLIEHRVLHICFIWKTLRPCFLSLGKHAGTFAMNSIDQW